jgi:hypothetical protein
MICAVCKEEKDLTNFYLTKDKIHYHDKCKKCYIAYTREVKNSHIDRDKKRTRLYEKYLKEFNKSNVEERYILKRNLYQENIGDLIKDQIWEKLYGNM